MLIKLVAHNSKNARSNFMRKCSNLPKAGSKWQEPVGYDTGIKIYNCVAKQKVPLILRNKNLATCYSCGPTVYDSAHIGHATCYLKLDIIQRVLKEFFGIKLITVMGITDVDDKIIKRALERNEQFDILAKRYEIEFIKDMKRLDIVPPHMTARVTEHMPQIVSFIKQLFEQGFAYTGEDGSVYFATNKYENYGKLQQIVEDEKKPKGKVSSADFALWKRAKENEPYWESPWGKGRPGWHIECSAIASHLLGRVIDIHTGGIDLRFPHHENEEAQSCAYHNHTQWINYWIHMGHLNIKDMGKMSKSLKNTISVSEFLEKYSSDVLRVACLLSHYRSSMIYSDEFMDHASAIYNKINSFVNQCEAYTSGQRPRVYVDEAYLFYQVDKMHKSIEQALRDDFDTAKCMSAITDLIDCMNKFLNSGKADTNQYMIAENYCIIAMVQSSVIDSLKNFGLDMNKTKSSTYSDTDFESLLNDVVHVREDLRQLAVKGNQNELFEVCDKIRNNLKVLGVEIKDHGKSSSWSFINRKNVENS